MKLLDKTVRNLLGYAVVVLLIGIPVFYFIIEQLYYQDVDDALRLKKSELEIRTKKLRNIHDVGIWLGMDQEVRVYPLSGQTILRDTIYPKIYLDTLAKEMEPYRELRTSMAINGRSYIMIIRRSLVESQDLIVGIAEAQAVLLILLFTGLIIINRQTSRRIWRPFDWIIDWLKAYEMGKDPDSHIPSSGISEFDTLNSAVNDLILKNHGIFIQQKTFIENASHEMQTPVAILQSKLDLLMVSDGVTAEQARYMQSQYEAIERLNHLNKSLLLLSQIENHQFEAISSMSLAQLTNKILTHLEEAIDEKQISLSIRLEPDRMLSGNPMLIEIAVSNLLSNAVNHTPAGGIIEVVLDRSTFHIRNSGEPLAFNREILFTRFGKGKASRLGVGLGLAIVRQIADRMGFRTGYDYVDGMHQFSIWF